MKSDMVDPVELEKFALKVQKLKAEGLPTYAIMSRLGVPRATLADRMRRYKELKSSSVQ